MASSLGVEDPAPGDVTALAAGEGDLGEDSTGESLANPNTGDGGGGPMESSQEPYVRGRSAETFDGDSQSDFSICRITKTRPEYTLNDSPHT